MAKKKKGGKGSAKATNNPKTNKGSRGPKSTNEKKYQKTMIMDLTEEDRKFRNSLESDGMAIVDMAPDGNCLFRALSDQLYGDYGNCHEEIRSDICDYMEENQDDFKVFLVLDDDSCEEGDDGKDFESYMQSMRQDGEWGGNLELVAAARLYQRKITVFSLTLSAYSIEPGDEKPSGPDLLVSFHDNDHYNSIRDEKSPPELPSKLNKLNHRPWSENGSSEASESTCTNSTATTSLSDMSLNDGIAVSKKAVKKNDTCPCGSGQRYRKCCLAKEKHAKRLGKMRGDSASEFDENDDDNEVAMKGNFQVLQI